MTRILPISLAATLLAASVYAQTPAPPTTQEKPRPKPGTILETPSTGGRITDAPSPAKQSTAPVGDVAGQPVERFEVIDARLQGVVVERFRRLVGEPAADVVGDDHAM